jgi:hypothetical protein
MENLDRIVADTLAQSGFETPVYLRPIPWSRWFRCESSFSLLLVPSAPGLYALAEEIVAPSEASAKRMLAVFDIGETDDLCVTLSRKFAPSSPLSERLSTGRCFVRFAQFRDAERRRMVCNSLKRWLAASSQAATGLPGDTSSHDIGIAGDFSKADGATAEAATDAMSNAGAAGAVEVATGAIAKPDTAGTAEPAAAPTAGSPHAVDPAAVRENHSRNLCHPERSEAAAERSRRTPFDGASSRTFTGIPTTHPAADIVESLRNTAGPTAPDSPDQKTESRKAAAGDEPPPLPSGF